MSEYGLIPDEWLMSYAAGALTEAEALLVATHVSYHPLLQARLAGAEAIGGALLEQASPAGLSDTAFDDVMARIDASAESEPAPGPPAPAVDADIPQTLRRYLGRALSDAPWRIMGPGMRQCRLAEGPGGQRLWLLKARGGTQIPVHDHRGTEFTLVLRGGYRVEERHFTPGLLEIADPEVASHQPLIDVGQECICLVITDAPIRLHSIMGRLVQPFIGL